jgi:hypothetical protein
MDARSMCPYRQECAAEGGIVPECCPALCQTSGSGADGTDGGTGPEGRPGGGQVCKQMSNGWMLWDGGCQAQEEPALVDKGEVRL